MLLHEPRQLPSWLIFDVRQKMKAYPTLAEIVGPWKESAFESGLIARCRAAWTKPIQNLSRAELAMLLRQKIAIDHLIPIAKKRIAVPADDDTEIFEGELAEAIVYAEKA